MNYMYFIVTRTINQNQNVKPVVRTKTGSMANSCIVFFLNYTDSNNSALSLKSKSLWLIWRSGTHRFHVRIHYIHWTGNVVLMKLQFLAALEVLKMANSNEWKIWQIQMMKISSKWRHFRFSVAAPPMAVKQQIISPLSTYRTRTACRNNTISYFSQSVIHFPRYWYVLWYPTGRWDPYSLTDKISSR